MMRESFELNTGAEGNLATVHLQPDDELPEVPPLPSEEMNLSEEGNNPSVGPSTLSNTSPKIFWPRAIDQKFMDVAFNTRDESGQHVECMAFICGLQDKAGNVAATHLVFPTQRGNSSRVEDLGIHGKDSMLYMSEDLASRVNLPGYDFKIISWVHTHVRGTKAGFSAIDLHNHHGLERHVSPGIFGTVYEITENRYMYHYEPYVLTKEGKELKDWSSDDFMLEMITADCNFTGCF